MAMEIVLFSCTPNPPHPTPPTLSQGARLPEFAPNLERSSKWIVKALYSSVRMPVKAQFQTTFCQPPSGAPGWIHQTSEAPTSPLKVAPTSSSLHTQAQKPI